MRVIMGMLHSISKTMDKLRSEFDRKENYPETKPERREVLNIASEINAVMLRRTCDLMLKRNGGCCVGK